MEGVCLNGKNEASHLQKNPWFYYETDDFTNCWCASWQHVHHIYAYLLIQYDDL